MKDPHAWEITPQSPEEQTKKSVARNRSEGAPYKGGIVVGYG